MAVLIVALATILAVNVTFRGMLDQRRAPTSSRSTRPSRSRSARRRWAADILRKDAQDSQTDHLGEIWAKPLPALPIDEGVGTVEGRLEDMQGRFNLNNLVFPDGTTNAEGGQAARAHPRRCCEIEPAWATRWRTGSTRTSSPGFPDGAEDSVYTGLDPPHLAANMPITRASETHGAARVRRRALREAEALRHGAAGRHQAQRLHGARASCSTRSRSRSAQFSLNPEDLAKRRKDALLPDARRPARHARPGRLRPDQGHAFGIKHLLPCDGMGHYWHHRVHPVQSARARRGRNGAARPAQFRSRMTRGR